MPSPTPASTSPTPPEAGALHTLCVATTAYTAPALRAKASSRADAVALHRLFKFEFGAARSALLLNPDSSRLIEQVRQMAAAAKPGDTFLLYLSGLASVSVEGAEYLLLFQNFSDKALDGRVAHAGPDAVALQYLQAIAAEYPTLRWLLLDDTQHGDHIAASNPAWYAERLAAHASRKTPLPQHWTQLRPSLIYSGRDALPEIGRSLFAWSLEGWLREGVRRQRPVVVDDEWCQVLSLQAKEAALRYGLKFPPRFDGWQIPAHQGEPCPTLPVWGFGRLQWWLDRGVKVLVVLCGLLMAAAALWVAWHSRLPQRHLAQAAPSAVDQPASTPVLPPAPEPKPAPAPPSAPLIAPSAPISASLPPLSEQWFESQPVTVADAQGHKAELVIEIFGKGEYHWGCADATTVFHKDSDAPFDMQGLWAQYQATRFWASTTRRIIAVGMASEEGAADKESRRACERAEAQLAWLQSAGFKLDNVQLHAMVLGQHRPQLHLQQAPDAGVSKAQGGVNQCRSGTEMQRQLVLIRVLEEDKGLDLHQALQQLMHSQPSGATVAWGAYIDPQFNQSQRHKRMQILAPGACLQRGPS